MRVVLALLALLGLLILASINVAAISNILCHESERQALLNFKQGLTDPSNRLASWVDGGNCCVWAGVVCHNLTGHVLELHLRNPCIYFRNFAEYQTSQMSKLGGQISDSLLSLKHLEYLDLSDNDFGGIQIPIFLGSMQNLRYLNMFGAGFGGMIPHQLGNLSNLQYLNLGFHQFKYTLRVENLQWLSDLSFLQYLDMSLWDLSKAIDWLQVINALPSLKELHLSKCQLYHVPVLSHVNFSSLVTLDLSGNQFTNSLITLWVSSLKSLISLDLNSNNFHGPIPNVLQNMTSLEYLDLSHNYFNSSLPSCLFNFSYLETLILQDNRLHGTISDDIGSLTSAIVLDLAYNDLVGKVPRTMGNLCSLQSIDFSGIILNEKISEVLEVLLGCVSDGLVYLSSRSCQLSGHLISELGQFKDLEHLDLSTNTISGPITVSLGLLASSTELYLSDNQLNGTLPECLGKLVKLEVLHIDHNSLEGIVSEVFFANLTRLNNIYASKNPLTLEVSPFFPT